MADFTPQENVELAKWTTWALGGPARFFVEVTSEDQLRAAVDFAKKENLPVVCLGGGSNFLFPDEGFPGVVLKFANRGIEPLGDPETDRRWRAEAGLMLPLFVRKTGETGHSRALSGIPGTLGGAVAMNAGSPDSRFSIAGFLTAGRIFDLEKGEFFDAPAEWFEFEYRQSRLRREPDRWIFWSGEFEFPELEDRDAERAAETHSQAKLRQPAGRSCGSVFKNPSPEVWEKVRAAHPDAPETPASGWLLDQVGMKGVSEDGMRWADKHANFLLHAGKGTATATRRMIADAAKKVREKFGVELELECRIVEPGA